MIHLLFILVVLGFAVAAFDRGDELNRERWQNERRGDGPWGPRR